jgi:hypothetical protein
MFRVPLLVVLPGLTLCTLLSHNTTAGQFSETDVVYEAARNKIGLIRYCRNNELLHPGIANEAIRAVEILLRELPSSNTFANEQGDSAQQAGEDGVQNAGWRDDVYKIAELFRTTPADLCQEWANDTLWGQAQRRYREVKTIAVVTPIQPFQPLPQAEPTPVDPIKVETIKVELKQVDRPPAPATAAVRVARTAPSPPLPEKAPLLPTRAELASLQRIAPAGGRVASIGRDVSGPISGTTPPPPSVALHSSGQVVPLSARQVSEAAGPPTGEQTVTAAAPPSRLWSFGRLGKRERCLMPVCKWSAPQEKDSGRY